MPFRNISCVSGFTLRLPKCLLQLRRISKRKMVESIKYPSIGHASKSSERWDPFIRNL